MAKSTSTTVHPCRHCGAQFRATHRKGLIFCSRQCYETSRTRPASAKFWERVAPPNKDGCRLWTGPLDRGGYGVFCPSSKTRMFGTHRFAYEDTHGPIPANMCVCHTCDVRACVEPAHLFLGTHRENTQDMYAKHRNRNPRGNALPQAKLTPETVVAIRQAYKRGRTQHELATEYGLNQQSISKVVNRKAWSHV